MHDNPTAEVIRRLNAYHDAAARIDEELAAIRHAEQQRGRIALQSPSLDGLPHGSGAHSDRTASLATSYTAQYYDDEIRACQRRIAQIRADRDWCTAAFASVKNRIDMRIIELAYLGPKEPEARERWLQRPTWYAIASKLGMSISQVTTRASRIVAALAENLDQITFNL